MKIEIFMQILLYDQRDVVNLFKTYIIPLWHYLMMKNVMWWQMIVLLWIPLKIIDGNSIIEIVSQVCLLPIIVRNRATE